MVLTSTNQEHVFNSLHFFVCKLTGGTPRKFYELFLHYLDLFVALLDEFEIGLQLPLFLESVLQAAYFNLTHCVVIENLWELKYEII